MMEISEEPVKWTVELEVALFRSMSGHKPVGLNKHFHMLCIQNKFHQLTGLPFSAKTLWCQLEKHYDLEALDELEHSPSSLEEKQEFELPTAMLPVTPSLVVDEGESTPSSSTGGRKRGRGSCTPSVSPSSSPVRTTKRKRL